jgi:hypothetical protein
MECCICLENGLEIIICRFVCSHKVCLKCVCELNSFLCPMCRADFRKDLPGRIAKIIEENRKSSNDTEYRPNNFDVNSQYHFPPLGN